MYNWNIEKIYNSKVHSVGVIPPDRFLVREYKSRADVKKAIADASPLIKIGSDKRGAMRISPAIKLDDKDMFKQEFLNTLTSLDFTVVDVIKPGPGAPSGKFDTYVVRAKTGDDFLITLAGGALSNKGMEYERDVFDQLQKYFSDVDDETDKPDFLQQLENKIGVEFVDYDKGASFTRNVKRPLTVSGPRDMGEVISDITLVDDSGKRYYISLKDVGGKTVANNGAEGMFGVARDRAFFKGGDANNNGEVLFAAANVNIERAVRGINDYITSTITKGEIEEDTTSGADLEVLLGFLCSAFDYGYYYVKRKNTKGDLEIEDLTDEQKLTEFIGEIEKVEVRYPYFNSENARRKHISIVLTTELSKYSIDIRNAKGGIIPNQINVVRHSSRAEVKQARKAIEYIDKSEKDLHALLDY
jgi:hypothetical protein